MKKNQSWKQINRWLAALTALLVLTAGWTAAETVAAVNELSYAECVEYKGNGVFEIDFLRDVAWREDFMLTCVDEAGNPLMVAALGGDASELFVQVEGTLAEDVLLTFRLVGDEGVICAVGQVTPLLKYANHCEYCLEFGHDEADCALRQATPGACENDRCDLCGQLGHDDELCPQRQGNPLYCDVCARFGHDDDHCPYDSDANHFCDACNQFGHDDDRCPNRGLTGQTAQPQSTGRAPSGTTAPTTTTARPEYCDECGQLGHDDDHCPNERCDECGQFGHDDDDCPNERCDECGQLGHDDDDCPNERCDECGQLGHDDDDCPNERCDECGQFGHDDDHCPNRAHHHRHHDD